MNGLKTILTVQCQRCIERCFENDPEYFAEIAVDFCKTQESETMKARAGSLLYNLCMYIDGNLTFVAKFALIPLMDLERKAIV